MSVARPPDVVVIVVDQWNFRCFGHRGHPTVETPHLDRLKRESADYRVAYAQNAICMPARVSLMTGRYVRSHRQYGFHGLVDEDLPRLPRLLRDHGYATCHVGKAHLNCLIDDLGFDEYVPTIPEDVFAASDPDEHYLRFSRSRGHPAINDQVHGGDRMRPLAAPRYDGPSGLLLSTGPSEVPLEDSIERYVADRAIAFIRRQGERPFLLHASFDRPHNPLSPSPPYDRLYDPASIQVPPPYTGEELALLPQPLRSHLERSRETLRALGEERMRWMLAHYFALMTHIDDEIGRIIAALREAGRYDGAILVFTADHGDFAGYKGLIDKHPNRLYHDEIIRVPLLVRYPGGAHAGLEIDEPAQAIDLLPTVCRACGVDLASGALDGRPLQDLLAREAQTEPRPAFSESYGMKAVRLGAMKLIHHVGGDRHELYDLDSDPHERRNLADDPRRLGIVIALRIELARWLTREPSERRKAFIRTLFDEARERSARIMPKLHKWTKGIADGGGFWSVCRGDHRLFCLPFDRRLILQRRDPAARIEDLDQGYSTCDDDAAADRLLAELIDAIAVKIHPLSLMTGSPEEQDNLRRPRGPGAC